MCPPTDHESTENMTFVIISRKLSRFSKRPAPPCSNSGMKQSIVPNDPDSSTGKQDNRQREGNQTLGWHPAFVEAIKLELEDYGDSLVFYPEFQLTAEPLRIDCVVVKKTTDIVIKKNIAAIFREVNLVEYKSPDDYISVDDFYKDYAYTYLYASFEKSP